MSEYKPAVLDIRHLASMPGTAESRPGAGDGIYLDRQEHFGIWLEDDSAIRLAG